MSEKKIAAFYEDPLKMACDAWSTAKAYQLRTLSTGDGLSWRAQRWARFIVRFGQGILRKARLNLGWKPAQGPVAGPKGRRLA